MIRRTSYIMILRDYKELNLRLKKYSIDYFQVEKKYLRSYIPRSRTIRELKYEGENVFNQANFLRVKHKYQFVVRLKAIKYKKDILCYLSPYIKLQTSSPC